MQNISATLRVLLLFIVFLLTGQAAAVGVGFALDAYSKTAALTAFIVLYYAMYWVAWRAALLIGDRSPEADTSRDAGSSGRLAALLLAPAVLALDLAD